jgi:hypothetical protein
MALPGDDLVAEPAEQITRAVTIDAEPDAVWPWIIQIGADRGGFYSHEWLENLFGLGIRNSEVVVLAWQHRDVRTGRPLRRDEQLRWEFCWSFVLRRCRAEGAGCWCASARLSAIHSRGR